MRGRKREDDRIHVTLKQKVIYEGQEGTCKVGAGV